ncbi:MAG: rhodanese-like domain-containing protein [Candidatus Eremiobacterota bacterium]
MRTWLESWTLVTLSLLLGLLYNQLSPVPLPVLGPVEFEAGLGALSVEQVRSYLGLRKAVPVDARAHTAFLDAHLPGAGSLPSVEFEAYAKQLSVVPKSTMLIVYCDDRSCGAEQRVARRLTHLGYYNVYTMPDGIRGWMARGYPVERGQP